MANNEIKEVFKSEMDMGRALLTALEQSDEVALNKRVITSTAPEIANAYAEAILKQNAEKYPALKKFSVPQCKGALKYVFNQVILAHILQAGVKL